MNWPSDKMGGDLDKIRIVGLYLIEVWKAAGMDLSSVIFKWASDEITNHAATYWPMMMDIARRFTITRIKKCCQIMGRLENNLSAAQILYPLMQCTDVFFLQADICQLGVDQRKVNMLAREYCDYAKRKHKPIILSHHMLYGLKQGQEKMSKSDPDSAIFMEDTVEDVQRKILNAYCPGGATGDDDDDVNHTNNNNTTTNIANNDHDDDDDDDHTDAGKASMHLTTDDLKNPCLDYMEHIIFSSVDGTATITVEDTTYTDFSSVKAAFVNGTMSEAALKAALIHEINQLLDPVRHHFRHDEHAKNLLDQVRQFKKESSSGTSGSSGSTTSTATTDKKTMRRLNLIELGKVASNAHVVLAPLPNAQPTLQEAMDILTQLRPITTATTTTTTVTTTTLEIQRPVVLLLQDWSAIVCNACSADMKAVRAYYTILVTSLRALDPIWMASVQILYQSDAILADPSNYWISVINVGRYFMLHQVMGEHMGDSDGVGKVIARLMTVADIVGLEPTSIALSHGSRTATVEQFLIHEYFTQQLTSYGMVPPMITMVDCSSLRLQPPRESDALMTEHDEYYLLDDPKVRGWMACTTQQQEYTCVFEQLLTNLFTRNTLFICHDDRYMENPK
jgi:tyrosyl-tRNA synthetase